MKKITQKDFQKIVDDVAPNFAGDEAAKELFALAKQYHKQQGDAIKFAEWIEDSEYYYIMMEEVWRGAVSGKVHKTRELLSVFLNEQNERRDF